MLQTRLATPDGRTARTTPTRLASVALLASLAALLLPVLVAAIPPIDDYPNHLARIWLLAGGASLPPVSEMYRVSWDTLTNIGIDLLAAGLGGLLPYDAIGRGFIAAAVVLPPLGGVLLWRAVHGGTHWWQLCFGLLAWSAGLLYGFLNFEIGLGLALLAAAADPALTRRGPLTTALGRALLGALLLLVHLFALVFYAALLAGLALGPDLRALLRRDGLLRAAGSVLVIAATLAVPALLLVLLAPSLPGDHAGTSLGSILGDFRTNLAEFVANPRYKVSRVVFGVRGYADWMDGLTLAVLGLPVLASLAFRRLAVHAGLLLMVLALVGLYFVIPQYTAGTYGIDVRFALMAALALPCALRPDLPPRLAGALAAALLTVSLARTAHVGWIWHARQADSAAVARAVASVPPGAAILPLQHRVRRLTGGPPGRFTIVGAPSYAYLPNLALPWRLAFVPTLFSARGKQPVQVLPPRDDLVEPDGGVLPSVHALTRPATYARDVGDARYLNGWRERFDYALVVNADMPDDDGPFTPPPGLALVADEGFAQLYRIDRAAPLLAQ